MPATSILMSALSSGISGIGNSRSSVLPGPVRTAANTFSVMVLLVSHEAAEELPSLGRRVDVAIRAAEIRVRDGLIEHHPGETMAAAVDAVEGDFGATGTALRAEYRDRRSVPSIEIRQLLDTFSGATVASAEEPERIRHRDQPTGELAFRSEVSLECVCVAGDDDDGHGLAAAAIRLLKVTHGGEECGQRCKVWLHFAARA